ncbi:phosphatidate cytidylyltransferase [soil metagenome]
MNNTLTRILVGIIGIPVFLILIIIGGIPFYFLSALIACFALWEFHTFFIKKNINSFIFPDIIFCLFLIYAFSYLRPEYIWLCLMYPLMIFTLELFRKNKNIFNPLVSISGVVYIVLPIIALNELIKMNESGHLMNYVMVMFILIWTCDTMSFFGGKLLGKHKLTTISPKKTVEGFICGILFTIIASFIIMYFNSELLNLKDALLFGIIISLVSPAGDIFESFIKRSVEIKDSSNIIPGHGGILDRFDSLLFCAPVILIYLKFLR